MQRIVLTIAILFAFASLAGVTTAHAHRYISTPIVVLNHVNAENEPIRVMVKVQRGEVDLGAGIIMPCGFHYGIVAEAPVLPKAPDAEKPVTDFCAVEVLGQTEKLLRPPIAA